MTNGMKTASWKCRFLNEDYFQRLYEAFAEAFPDYVIPFALTEAQFRNHIILNAVDVNRSVGCIDGERLIGFSLNGFGAWRGKQTVYDAGTGVIPDFRRQGVSEAIFEMMLPVFKSEGIEQCLLEVVSTNTRAVCLYEKLGFRTVRELALLQCDGNMTTSIEAPQDIEIRELAIPDWDLLSTFWDGRPSWQNSVDAVGRSYKVKRVIGAFSGEKCIGYIVFSSKFGRIAQLAVDKDHRGRGIGTALLRAMQSETADGFSMQVINIDTSLTTAITFFNSRSFREMLIQYEMLLQM